ncbi:sporulation-induced protein [Podospora pseudopauciseta]|uniref:Sporulation-induced protein n=1 Tax=Podospora pseudopauciseta TaxID=2093780 RepID=A0ABR0H8P1_9PEZI|nr:sporulation-induced protein [Podospora pseudopauciseta]
MFWRFGGYNVSTIDTILEKESFQLEELLDESDLIQELKQHNPKLVEYLREQQVLEKLLQYVVAPKLEPVAAPDADEEEEQEDDEIGRPPVFPTTRSRSSSRATEPSGQEENEKKRNRYAFVAAEILSSDNYSIHEALMESRPLLRNFWEFLKRPTPLDPLQASYFTKVNESLFDKKTEEMLDLLKSFEGAIADILRHVDCPMIMDLLLKIISLERTESGQGVVEWLYTQNVMPTLLSFLGPEHSWATQTSAADFIKAIITVSANASQNEQTCIGPNELTRQLVSRPCVEQLIQYMLGGGNPLTCGVGIIIEVIRKNNSDYDPEGVDANAPPSCRDPIYLGTLLRLFADHVPDFMSLIMNSTAQKERLSSTFGDKIEPLGFDRFKTCELMAELLHCSNMGLLNEVGSEQFIAARDAQRQRLREEGRLIPARGVDDTPSSTEDLTMRTSQSSPAEERRKLEVMNISADDDGFEEVSHDTSDDVLELPDAPAPTQAPAFSMLEKDDADFVDEPLSSPRLNFKELDAEKRAESPPAFEDPDLVVAPLSPTKKAAQTGASKDQQSPPKPVADEKEPQTSDKSKEISTAELPALSTKSSVPKALDAADTLSPHPGDTPAPLFSSATAAKGDEAKDKTEQTSEPSPSPPKAEAAEDSPAGANANETTGEISIIIAPASDSATPAEGALTAPRPVVGDYLKMQFVRQEVVPTILRFFFKYPWNNFLHNVVYDIVQQVFNGPMDRGFNPTLAISLFEAADITNQIINGQLASEESQAQHKTRMGYMGHLTLIAEEVVKFTERHPPELLSEVVLDKVMAQDWISYVEGALAETRERDNAILGGVRPEVAMSNRAAQSSLVGVGLNGLSSIGLGGNNSNTLADAGLGGGSDLGDGSGAGASPFGISSGTMMSGFGSSSDEDEDEEQESEEDVNNEFRAYTDPLNANSSNSLNPPSIPPPPPPPPPLNIMPSRARMQLAARLAKRNAAAAAENGGQEGSSSNMDDGTSDAFTLPSLSASERLRNPFADDGDDEDNSSDEDNLDNAEDEGGASSSAWNRGSWWRGVVGGRSSSRRQGDNENQEKERFGDGRDDTDDSDDAVHEDDIDDEEFGDFAMPEVQSSGAMVSGIDPAREKILVKPMALHPSATKSSFGSLWPFGGQGFGANKEKEKEQEKKTEGEQGASTSPSSSPANAITEEPVELGKEEDEGVIGEDGQKINRAVEAKRRTSIEDPDDDDVGGEEIIVHKGPGVH